MASGGILVVAEMREGRVTGLTREVLGLARELDTEVAAAAFANEAAGGELISSGAGRVYLIGTPSQEYEGEVWVANLEALARELKPRAILVPHTASGADLVPRLAFGLEGGAAMGCVGVAIDAGRLHFTRPCYGGNVRETLSFSGVAVASIKAGVGTAHEDPSHKGEITRVAPLEIEPRFRVVAREREAAAGKQLEDAKIVIAGGRGLEGPEGFRVLEDLAGVLDAAVGASRVPCDLGWCPHSWQIGLTGRTVTPDLYFAVGISGAGHHLAGCGNSKTIVAINTDRDAAIFREARFGIVGDYREVVPALTQVFAEMKET